MIKSKICLTVFVLYEIFAVMLMHSKMACYWIGGVNFCNDDYRYFIACFAVPAIIFLIWMWIDTIIFIKRHRFWYRAGGAIKGLIDKVRDNITLNVSRNDMEKYITAAILFGTKYYISKHPKIKNMFHDFMPDNDMFDDDDETMDAPKKKTKKVYKSSGKNKKR